MPRAQRPVAPQLRRGEDIHAAAGRGLLDAVQDFLREDPTRVEDTDSDGGEAQKVLPVLKDTVPRLHCPALCSGLWP